MQRMTCIISYDGTNFSGYQIQPNGRTVQEELERALTKIHKGNPIRVTASGRTDAGVHAVGQVIHFDTTLSIPAANWAKALNAILPDDILVKSVRETSDTFHARFSVKEKEYHYIINNSEQRDVFKRNYAYFIKDSLNVQAMKEACSFVEGTHDFSSFCAANTNVKGEKVRTIYYADCYQEEGTIVFIFKGSGFLYNMVRILVGTIIEVGKGIREPSDLGVIIQAKNRKEAGKTAPPHGLYMWDVTYEDDN